MGVGYVFHCSRCMFPHAGECVVANPCREICLTCPAGFCANHPPPTVGSRWKSRVTFEWAQTMYSRWSYEVREIGYLGIRTAGYDGDGGFCGDRLVSPAAWTSEGAVVIDGPGRTHRLWMLPESTP